MNKPKLKDYLWLDGNDVTGERSYRLYRIAKNKWRQTKKESNEQDKRNNSSR